jgi:dihydroorotate dehydrogenase electron transfer subunit
MEHFAKMRPMPIAQQRGQFTASVLANVGLCREHYRLTLLIADFPPSRPGQFVQLQCRDIGVEQVDHVFDWSPGEQSVIQGGEFRGVDAFLRRPFSVAGRRDRADGWAEIDIIGREIGPGTRFLARLQAGDQLSVVGPLGNTFTLPEPNGIALLVGGGVGIPPMIYLAQMLGERASARGSLRTVAFAGAMTRELMALTVAGSAEDPPAEARPPGEAAAPLFNVLEFARFGVPAVLTTDDGSLGAKGYVTDALERYLDAYLAEPDARTRTTIYTCGPELMMKRVQQIAEARSIRVQIAVERAMACGMGTCQSCCIRVKKPDPTEPPLPGKTWCYRLACTDGPVFGGDVLLW